MAAKVKWIVAVKEPIARTLRNPSNGARIARIKTFSHDHVTLRVFSINIVMLLIATAIHAEIEPMRMQWVPFEGRVDPAPANCVALGKRGAGYLATIDR